MATTSGTSSTESLNSSEQETSDRLKVLYPAVNEEETPLPRSWSSKDKYNYIGLSQNNLRVHYKGEDAPLCFPYLVVLEVDYLDKYRKFIDEGKAVYVDMYVHIFLDKIN